jgi:hypothetical protein
VKTTFFLLLMLISACALAQEQNTAPSTPQQGRPERRQGGGPRGGGMFGGGPSGAITEIKDGVLTIKSSEGKTLTVKTGENTRFMGKERTPISLKDLKVGDYVMAGGQPGTDGTIEARMVAQLDDEAVKRMKDAAANMGKTMIAGEVKEINETKITVLRIDGQTQVIDVDENTSLKKQGESITLADMKAGDRISGTGELKAGNFVAKELRVAMMGGGGMQRRQGAPVVKPAESKTDKQ